jgi:hypothetical protein
MARAVNSQKPRGTSSAPFVYPTPAMVEGYAGGINGMPGTASPLGLPYAYDTSNLGAPAVGGPMTVPSIRGRASVFAPGLSARERMAILILGADAGSILFPPQQPLQPIAQAPAYAGIGRQWDYPVGYNTRVPPRSGAGVTFATLREMATYDVLRIMIERVKDKVNGQAFSIGMKDEKAQRQPICDEIDDFLSYPDKLNCWDDWLRMLMEQVIVYDAPAVWLQPTRGGELAALQIIDGSLVSPKIMADGRLPPPEYGPAYQQVIKGLPAIDYIQPLPLGAPDPGIHARDPSTGELLPELYYRPRNKRIDTVYGYSPVEQIIRTIEIGVAQEEWLRDYFTEGSTPDLLLGVPDNWNPGQIQQMQDHFDAMLVGNLKNRRKAKFIPGGIDPVDTKEKALMDSAVQEWLVRVMAFALGLNVMPFVRMMNKGQEATHHEESKEEGLRPWLEWVSNFMNTLIALKWGRRDVVFRWVEEDDTDPKTAMEIDKMAVEARIYHPDEIRIRRGDQPMEEEMRSQMDMANFNPVNATVLPPDQQAEADERAEVAAQAQAGRDEAMVAMAAKEKGREKATEKLELAALVKSLQVAPPSIHVDAPTITMPPINLPEIKIEGATISMPPPPAIKMGDVFVDVGPSNVRVDVPKPATPGKVVTAQRNADGTFTGTITEGAPITRTVRTDASGNVMPSGLEKRVD